MPLAIEILDLLQGVNTVTTTHITDLSLLSGRIFTTDTDIKGQLSKFHTTDASFRKTIAIKYGTDAQIGKFTVTFADQRWAYFVIGSIPGVDVDIDFTDFLRAKHDMEALGAILDTLPVTE